MGIRAFPSALNPREKLLHRGVLPRCVLEYDSALGFASQMKHLLALRLILLTTLISSATWSADSLVYIGTYTGAKSKGIYALRLSDEGKLTPLGLVTEMPNPTYLALHPNGKFLYAVNEVSKFGELKAGSVSAFSIDPPTGQLTALNRKTSGGAGPCHLDVRSDRTGRSGGGNGRGLHQFLPGASDRPATTAMREVRAVGQLFSIGGRRRCGHGFGGHCRRR